jgi:ABC-type Fe3+ transport system permease subunit
MALEQIREQEEQLKQIMIYAGRPGLWGDWQRFQAKARIARREAEVAAAKRRQKMIDWTLIIMISSALLAILVGFILLLAHHQGKL